MDVYRVWLLRRSPHLFMQFGWKSRKQQNPNGWARCDAPVFVVRARRTRVRQRLESGVQTYDRPMCSILFRVFNRTDCNSNYLARSAEMTIWNRIGVAISQMRFVGGTTSTEEPIKRSVYLIGANGLKCRRNEYISISQWANRTAGDGHWTVLQTHRIVLIQRSHMKSRSRALHSEVQRRNDFGGHRFERTIALKNSCREWLNIVENISYLCASNGIDFKSTRVFFFLLMLSMVWWKWNVIALKNSIKT